MLNYTSRPYDVLVLAHELGHGVHASLARPQGIFQFTTPLTMAETASIFGETIVLERLLERAPDADERLSLLAGSLDGAVAADLPPGGDEPLRARDPHRRGASSGELPADRFAELWLETQADLLGDAVELHDDYGIWWSYIPHFVDAPGYVYAYAYGNLLALSVYRRYEEEGEGFVDSYLELLRAGGSRPPEELGRIVGVDLADPGFWSSGPRPGRAPARGRRARGRGGRPDRMIDTVEELIPLPIGEVALTRPRDADALLTEEQFEREEFLPYWAELWSSGVALAHDVSRRSLRGAPVLELGCGLGLPSIAAALAGGRFWPPTGRRDAIRATADNARRNGVEVETAIVAWGAPEPIVERGAVALRARLGRPLRAAQRRPAARAAAAARGPRAERC